MKILDLIFSVKFKAEDAKFKNIHWKLDKVKQDLGNDEVEAALSRLKEMTWLVTAKGDTRWGGAEVKVGGARYIKTVYESLVDTEN